MANIIDTSFFYQQLAVPQITDPGVSNELVMFIKDYEPSLLTNLLGYELYKAYLALPGAARMVNLLSGDEFVNRCGELTKWKGLVFIDGSLKKSLIANHVYYWFTRNQATNSTSGGEKTTKSENSVEASPRFKQSRAWNEMVDFNLSLREYLLVNSDVYPEYKDPFANRRLVINYDGWWYLGNRHKITAREELFIKMNPFL